MAENVREMAGLRDGVAESVVGVLRNCGTGRVEETGYVSVVVVERDVDGIVDRKVEESADAASALQRAGEVFAPIVTDCGRGAVCIGDALLDEVPVIVEEGG